MSCESLPALSDTVLRPIARLLGADSAVYMRFRQDSGGQPFICESEYTGPHPESVDAYVSGFYVEDPVMRPLIDRAGRGVASGNPMKFQLSNQVQQGALRRSNYFRNFLKPHDLGDVMGVALPFNGAVPQLLCLGLHRHAGRPAFGKRQRLALEAVMRPVCLVLETLCMRSSLAEQSALIQSIEESNAGVEYAVLNDQLRLVRGSRRMQALLTANYTDPQALASIWSGVQMLGESSADSGRCVDVLLPDGQPGKLSAAGGCGQRSYVLVPGGADRRPVRRLPAQRVHPGEKLTAREQQVIDQLSTGSSNAGIAEMLNISVRTVENHLRSIYEKLGINSRTQLISLLFAQ
tara:strand:+ start:11270 stop:12316 length:1047 start_codon:yes stop_codon:yes gene_type:complete